MSDDQEALSVARGLTDALSAMALQLSAVNQRVEDQAKTQDMLTVYGRRNRHLIRFTFASIILDVIVTVLLVFVYGSARNSAVEATSARAVAVAQHSNLIASCRLSNQSRAASIQLWVHLASISHPAPHSTRAQVAADKRKVAALILYVKSVYAPRNCIALYRLPPAQVRK